MKLFLIILGVFVGAPSIVNYYFAHSIKEAIFLFVAVGCLILAFSRERKDRGI